MKSNIVLILPAIVLLVFILSIRNLAAEKADHEEHHDIPFSWFSLIKPLGIATLSSICTTFLTGIFRRKLGRRFRRIHLALAIISVTLALAHGTLVLVLFGL